MDADNLREVPMQELDLLDFTNTYQKIPKNYLGPEPLKKTSRLKIMLAHLVDFYMVFTIFNIFNVFINFNLNRYIITDSMEFSSAIILKVSIAAPLILLSYYFFSFFFNHGQTLGMKSFKLRMVIPEQSINDSFITAYKTVLSVLTFGLAKKFIGENVIKHEDYLYAEFMIHRDLAPINLLDETYKNSIEDKSHPNQIAA
jgi:hypothetical protein